MFGAGPRKNKCFFILTVPVVTDDTHRKKGLEKELRDTKQSSFNSICRTCPIVVKVYRLPLPVLFIE